MVFDEAVEVLPLDCVAGAIALKGKPQRQTRMDRYVRRGDDLIWAGLRDRAALAQRLELQTDVATGVLPSDVPWLRSGKAFAPGCSKTRSQKSPTRSSMSSSIC